MTAVVSPRAQLVELLWQLKQAFDQRSEGSDVRFIHFNTLLNDSQYRSELVQQAIQSGDRRLRELGVRLAHLNQQGELLNRPSSGRPAGVPLILNPDIAETLANRKSGWPTSGRRLLLWLAALSVLLLAGMTGWQHRATLQTLLHGEEIISGSITSDTHWRADTTWRLRGVVYVEGNASLTIEPGTTVLGEPGSALVITRNAALHARGRADQPIVMTSAQPPGSRQRGDWGGVVLLGNAPVNQANASIEGIPANDPRGGFGGTDPDHSCGALEYTRIEFAGFEVYRDNELNGLTLGGCGRHTLIHHVQVHQALDDGIELFGGTVDLRHVLVSGAGDDSLDWDLGWQGRVQFLVAQQHSRVGDNAFEGDNNKQNHDALPRSAPTMYNVTLVSPRSHEKFQRAMTLRRGTAGEFHNFIIEGFSGELVDVRDAATVKQMLQGSTVFANALVDRVGQLGRTWFSPEHLDNDDDSNFDEYSWFAEAQRGLRLGSSAILPREASRMTSPDFTPLLRSPARSGASVPPQGEFWDEAADYLGAFRPGSSRSWLDGWTAFPVN